MRNAKKSPWKVPWKGIIVAFAFSSLALVLVFSKIAAPADVFRELQQYPLPFFFLAILAVVVSWVVDGQRIGTLARSLGQDLPWWYLALVLSAANFVTLVTPFAGGGGALIVYFLYQRGLSTPKATAVVIAGGIAGQMTLSTLAILVFPALKSSPSDLSRHLLHLRLALLAYILVLITLLLVISRSKRLSKMLFRKKKGLEGEASASRPGAWLEEFQETLRAIFAHRRGRTYLRTLLIAFSYYVVYYLAGFALLSGFDVFHFTFRYAMSVLLGIAPVFSPIPGGAGAAELVAYLVLEKALSKDVLGTFILLWRTVVFYIPILVGGTLFTVFLFKWAGSRNKQDSPAPVILPEENDHNR